MGGKTLQTHLAECGWCEQEFTIRNGGQLGAFRLGRNVYCSMSCQRAMNNSRDEYKKMHGPCPTCGKMFKSRAKKIFCTMACYMLSPKFSALQKTLSGHNAKINADRLAKQKPCPNCGKDVIKGRKYCGKMCRREFFSNRFDRWVANPEQIALPQCYDEFLDSLELPCLVDGCDWKGKLLSNHCNFTHGITAKKLKEMAGFNRSTGLVSKDVFLKLSESKKQAYVDGKIGKAFVPAGGSGMGRGARRLEGIEHANKARALMMEEGPSRHHLACLHCGADVVQPTAGRKKYCSTKCRSRYYAMIHSAELLCGYCGAAFMGSIHQVSRTRRKLPVFCTLRCRQIVNSTARIHEVDDA